MDRKLSDEQLDRIAKNLLQDFAPDDETLAEIAESPRLWWSVRSRIETEKARRERSRFAVFRPPVLAFGAAAILACCGLAVLFLNFSQNSNSGAAERNPVRNSVEETVKAPEDSPVDLPKPGSGKPEISTTTVSEKAPVRKIQAKAGVIAKNRIGENSPKHTPKPSKISPPEKVEETKTDFIALSYAANTESGQIVRLKVPSSMMVSLGVKTSVEKDPELVNAEVVIGDDGLARAIRFIR